MKTYVCNVCKHVAFDQAPVACPVCRASIENFENDPDVIILPSDPENLTEVEKKHVPMIEIKRQCGLDSNVSCIDVHIQVGETIHVMESEHLINFIDLYHNRSFITRLHLTHKMLYPAAGLHLKIDEGVLSVIANCNIHGHWRARVNLAS